MGRGESIIGVSRQRTGWQRGAHRRRPWRTGAAPAASGEVASGRGGTGRRDGELEEVARVPYAGGIRRGRHRDGGFGQWRPAAMALKQSKAVAGAVAHDECERGDRGGARQVGARRRRGQPSARARSARPFMRRRQGGSGNRGQRRGGNG